MSLRLSILSGAKILALTCALVPVPALAGPDVAAQVTRQLSAQGYRQIESRRTLLGKVVVTARGKDHLREIVIDPRSGALLRDLVREDKGGRDGASIARVGDRRGDDDADDGDKDDGDKDDGDDNSGSGSSGDDDDDNSGSGSGSDDDGDDDSSGSGSGGDDDDSNSGDSDSDDSDGPDRDDD